jgi:hypothetical protein
MVEVWNDYTIILYLKMKTNPNTKNNYKKQYSYEQMTPPVEEFGLGIQVFKI